MAGKKKSDPFAKFLADRKKKVETGKDKHTKGDAPKFGSPEWKAKYGKKKKKK